jgi:hypothetical protein
LDSFLVQDHLWVLFKEIFFFCSFVISHSMYHITKTFLDPSSSLSGIVLVLFKTVCFGNDIVRL